MGVGRRLVASGQTVGLTLPDQVRAFVVPTADPVPVRHPDGVKDTETLAVRV